MEAFSSVLARVLVVEKLVLETEGARKKRLRPNGSVNTTLFKMNDVKVKLENSSSSAAPSIKQEPNTNAPNSKRQRKPLLGDAELLEASEVDTSRILGPGGGTKMWLVKVPKFLADEWLERGKTPNADLGQLTVETWLVFYWAI